jgi:hypothetical protein
VKLDAFDGEGSVAESHNGLAVGGAGGNFELGWETFFGDYERVVAGAGHRGGDVFKDGPAVVLDLAGLAVHELGSADYVAAEGCTDGLMAEADAEDGDDGGDSGAGKVLDEPDADAGVLRSAGAGRDEDAVGMQGFDFGGGELVVAADDHLGAQLAHVLDEVVGEGVVVVEDEYHGDELILRPLRWAHSQATGVTSEPSNLGGE